MRYNIYLVQDAVEDLNQLSATDRAAVREHIVLHLGFEPTKVSKSRIKRLKGLSKPQYRLRVDDIRVYYDVKDNDVEVLAIIKKDEAEAWLAAEGVKHERSSAK